jgi:HK97 family phage major capsid protein
VKKTIKQLKDSKNEALQTMQNLIENAESEDRNLSADEQAAWNEAEKQATDYGARVERLERSMDLSKSPVTPVTFETQNVGKTDKDLKRFSFTAAATAAYNGQMDGLVREMHQEARNENKSRLFRGVGIPSIVLESRAAENLPAASGNVKPTDVGSFTDQLQANLALVQAGANFYSGISADRKFPIIAGISSGFVAEDGGSGQSASGNIDAITLSPNKLISQVSMSAEMMTQNASAEAALQRNMAASISAAWELALLQSEETTSQGPNSIFYTADAVTGSGDLSKEELFELEKDILSKNFNPASGRFSYIMNAGALEKIKLEAGVDYVSAFADFAQKQVNGYPYHITSNCGYKTAENATQDLQRILFGDFSDVHLATFGGLDVISDRYTDAHKGLSRLVIVSLVDGKAARVSANGTSLAKFTKAA